MFHRARKIGGGIPGGFQAFWRFNEGAGQVAYDSSPNGCNLQLGSTTSVDTNDPAWIPIIGGLSFAGDDALRQSKLAEQIGVVTISQITNAGFINDSGQDFTPYVRTTWVSKYMLAAFDGTKYAWGYAGEEGGDGIVQLTPVQRDVVLTAADAAINDFFGASVSLSSDGNILAVGAYLWEGTAGADQGGVYIFDRSGSTWVQRDVVLTPVDAATSDRFGISVSLSSDGNILAVGAYLWEGIAADQGGVYIFDRSGSTWIQRGNVLTPVDASTSGRFGISVSLSSDGNILAVGAYLWEGIAADQGGVYIFDRSIDTWIQRDAVLTAADAAAGDNFGISVSLSSDGNILAVGAYLWEGAIANQGGVYIYSCVLPANTGLKIYSTKTGVIQNWANVETGFDPKIPTMAYEIRRVLG